MNCITRVKEYVDEQGLKIPLSRIQELARQLQAAGGDTLSRAEFAAKLQDVIDTDLTQFQAKSQAVRAMTLAAREQAIRQIENKEFGGSTFENLRSWVDGSSLRKGDSVNMDVRRMKSFVQGDLAKIWARGIEPFKREAESGVINREIFQELDALQRGLPVGQTKNTAAVTIARAAYALENEIVDRKKAVNPFFETTEGYLMKQSHDRVKVGAVEEQEWVADALKAFGQKSFPELSLDEKAKAFSDIYNRIKSGTWGTVSDDLNPNNFQSINGPGGDILRRMNRQRQLIPTDSDSFSEYNSKYGYGSITDTMNQVMRRAAQDIAVLDKFGPNPTEMYQGVVSRTYSRASPEDQLAIKAGQGTLDAAFKNAVGMVDAPAQTLAGKLVQGVQAWQYLTKGGGGVLRALPDIAIASSRIRDLTGKNIFGVALQLMGSVSKNMLSAGRTEAMQDLSMVAHSTLGDVLANLGAVDSRIAKTSTNQFARMAEGAAGKISDLADAYGSVTLHKQWVDSMRLGVSTFISKWMGRLSEGGWDSLPQEWQDGFRRYGISEPEWDLMRQSPLSEGHNLMTPEGVQQLPDAAVEQYMRDAGRLEGAESPSARVLDYERYKLAQKYGTLLNDHADYGTVNPNTRQRAFMNRGLNADDPWGMALRLLTQFKMAALVTSDSYRRAWLSSQTLGGKLAGLTSTAALGMFMYGIGEYANQFAQGKTPEDPTTPEMMMKLVAGSGAGGIFADVMDQAAQQNGVMDAQGAILSSLAGPAITGVANLGAQAIKGVQSATEDKPFQGGAAAKWGIQNLIPAQNLFYTKALTNFYFANSLREFLGPGYLNNLEMRTEQKPGVLDDRQRYMFLRPTDSPRW